MTTGKNRYARRSHLSEAQIRRLVRLFAADLPAATIATLTGLSRRTVNRYVQALRERMAAVCEAQAPYRGEVEVDESYFGKRRVRGKRGRGAGGKTIVFGIFKRNGHVYTEIVPDVKKATLLGVIRGRVALESVMHSDEWKAYDGWSIWATRSTSACGTPRTSLRPRPVTSTASRASGAAPRHG